MKQIILTMVAMWATVSASAQETIQNAYQKVIGNSAVELLSRSDYQDRTDSPTTYCKFTEFKIPESNKNLIKQMEQAMLKDQDRAYSFFIRKPEAKMNTLNTKKVVYGPNNEYGVTLGSNKSHYYYSTFFKEPSDSTRRHAYAFVWFKEGKDFHCYYYHIYGMTPEATKSVTKNSLSSLASLSSLDKGNRIRSTLSGNTLIIEQYDEQGNKTLQQVRVSDDNKTTDDLSADDVTDKPSKVTNDVEFMTQFGLLRVAFLDAIKDPSQKMLQVGLATKIVALCKDHSNLLTYGERTTCKNTILDMTNIMNKTVRGDIYLEGMLKQAIDYLGKK